MKKLLTLILAIVMLFTMSITAFAGGFVQSPSLNKAPRIMRFFNESEECKAELVITAYADRYELSDADRKEIEAAYAEIKAAEDLTTLAEALAKLAKEKKIPTKQLAVSDLFDEDYINCDRAEHKAEHGYFTVELEADTLKNFVGLLHRNENGSWEVISNATAKDNILTFKVKDFSPFAIVVDTNPNVSQTGDSSNIYLWAAIALISAAGVVFCLVKSRKTAVK